MNEIIHKIGYLTLAIELIAKIGQKMGITLQEYYLKLEEKGFDISTVVNSNWDNNGEKLYAALSKHFAIVFDLTNIKINLEAIYILKNFSILPYLSIKQDDIIRWLHLDQEDNMLVELVDLGWLQKNVDFEYMMHPVISYTVQEQVAPKVYDCINLIDALSKAILLEIGSNYLQVFQYLPYANSVGEYFVKTNDKEGILSLLYIRLAEIYRQNGEYIKGYVWGKRALNCMNFIVCERWKGDMKNLVYNVMSEICLDMRDCDKECMKWARYAVDSDKMNKEWVNDIRKSISLHNLACAYIQLQENDKALLVEKKQYLFENKIYYPQILGC